MTRLIKLMDHSVLKDMFEENNEGHAVDLMNKMKEARDLGIDKDEAIIPMAQFFRAMWLADTSKMNMQNIQKVLSFAKITPSFTDFKDGDACRNEMITIAKVLTKAGEQNEED